MLALESKAYSTNVKKCLINNPLGQKVSDEFILNLISEYPTLPRQSPIMLSFTIPPPHAVI